MLLSELFVFFSLSFEHRSLSIFLSSLERLVFLLMMFLNCMLFSFESVLDLRLSLM